MTALPPVMNVTFGAPSAQVLNIIRNNLDGKSIPYTLGKDRLHFQIGVYNLHLHLTAFPENMRCFCNCLTLANKTSGLVPLQIL